MTVLLPAGLLAACRQAPPPPPSTQNSYGATERASAELAISTAEVVEPMQRHREEELAAG